MRTHCLEKRSSAKRLQKPGHQEQLPITGESLARLSRLFILLASVPLPESSLEEGNEEREISDRK